MYLCCNPLHHSFNNALYYEYCPLIHSLHTNTYLSIQNNFQPSQSSSEQPRGQLRATLHSFDSNLPKYGLQNPCCSMPPRFHHPASILQKTCAVYWARSQVHTQPHCDYWKQNHKYTDAVLCVRLTHDTVYTDGFLHCLQCNTTMLFTLKRSQCA